MRRGSRREEMVKKKKQEMREEMGRKEKRVHGGAEMVGERVRKMERGSERG